MRGVLHPEDAGIVSQSSGGLERMMTMIVTVCSLSGLTVSQSKTEIMCLPKKCGEMCHSPSLSPVTYTNKQCIWAEI